MTSAPFTRLSHADFGRHREYILVIEDRFVYVTVTKSRALDTNSTLRPDQRPLAGEWVAETAKDIAAHYGGDPSEVYKLICEHL